MKCPICKNEFQFISHLRTHGLNQLATALWFELRNKEDVKTWQCANCGFRVQHINNKPMKCASCDMVDTFAEIQLSNMDREMKL